jgi:hypothetical protein
MAEKMAFTHRRSIHTEPYLRALQVLDYRPAITSIAQDALDKTGYKLLRNHHIDCRKINMTYPFRSNCNETRFIIVSKSHDWMIFLLFLHVLVAKKSHSYFQNSGIIRIRS